MEAAIIVVSIMFLRRPTYIGCAQSFDKQFLHIVESLANLPEATVVDGEVVAIDERGRAEFNLLQNFRAEAARIDYYVFDLLRCEGHDLIRLP